MFPPVIKKFDCIKKVPRYQAECWSIDPIGRSRLAKFNKN